jgi:conjugative relaxase-like TrwC/TraI family protein
VLSRGKVTPLTVAYYTDEVAAGLEDYYAGRGEAVGHWVASGSAAAGLAGEVSAQQLARLFDAVHPDTGEALGAPYRVRAGADRVTGWDLTFSAPKSLSALWALGGGEVGMAAREAHDAAVATGLAYLEEHAAFSRQGKAGIRQVDTEGVVAAAFVHRTSRAEDPQLHTHVLVSARVRCEDGTWRALDSRALHRELKSAGMVYQAALRAETTARLGVIWGPVDRHGQADIAGVPAAVVSHYSKRRRALEAEARARITEAEATLERSLTPEERRRTYQQAALETRLSKGHPEVFDLGLHDAWRADAAEAGLAPEDWLGEVLGRQRPAHQIDPETVVVEECLGELATSNSTWGRSHVVRQVARRVPVDVGDAEAARRWVERATDAVLAHPDVVALVAPAPEPPDDLRRRDGRSVYEAHGAPRFSTLATLATEQHVLDAAVAGREAGRSVADPDAIEVAIATHGLGKDQAEALRRLTLAGQAICCVVGPAGAGKSRAMGAAADAWADSGVRVRGLAVSATAAGVLATEAEIPTETIAKFLYEHRRPGGPDPQWRLRRGEVVVVDSCRPRNYADCELRARTSAASPLSCGSWGGLVRSA